jgi:hypothetical protein
MPMGSRPCRRARRQLLERFVGKKSRSQMGKKIFEHLRFFLLLPETS